MSKTTPTKAPVELDDFDRIEEMFHDLNNALAEKEEELKEGAEALKERKKQLEKEEADLRDDNNELEDKRAEIKKEAEDYEKLKGSREAVKRALQARIKELEKRVQDHPQIPTIFSRIPPAIKNNTLPFMNRLRDFNSALYNTYLKYYNPIVVALRHVHEMAMMKGDDKTCLTIAGVFYSTQFDASNPEEIYHAAETFIMSIIDIKNDELQKAMTEFIEKVLRPLEDLANK